MSSGMSRYSKSKSKNLQKGIIDNILPSELRKFLLSVLFPNLTSHGKREYFTRLILNCSIYLSLVFFLTIFLGFTFLIDPTSVAENEFLFLSVTDLIWNPDVVLMLSYYFIMIGSSIDIYLFINASIITIIVPNFTAGFIVSLKYKRDAYDLPLICSLTSFILYLIIGLTQYLALAMFGEFAINLLTTSAYLVIILTQMLYVIFLSVIAGFIGVILGNLIANFLPIRRKGSKISYSPIILPDIPLHVESVFDMVSVPKMKSEHFQKVTMIYLHGKMDTILRYTKDRKTCPYFSENRCAYLTYLTAAHRIQICVSGMYNLCRVYSFIRASSKIVEEANQGVKNEEN